MISKKRAFFGANSHSVVIAAMALGALWLAVLILPGDAERIAMLERDGLEREALSILEQKFESGDRDQRTLYQLSRLYEQLGRIDRAHQMMEQLAEKRPRDIAVLTRLAAFHKQMEDRQSYAQYLNRLIDLKYSETTCKELAGILRLNGDYAEEQAALQKCRQKGYRRTEDMVRLAQLVAADGDVAQASVLLRGVDDLKRLKSQRERLQLFAMLLNADQPKEALRRAIRWGKGSREENLCLTLIDMLLRASKQDLAMELAREVSVPGDRVSLTIAEIMVERSETTAAQAHLRRWLEKARQLDGGLATRFVDVALAADDVDVAFKGAKRVGWERLPQAQLAAIAEGLAAVGKRAELDVIKEALTAETVERSPILSAALRNEPLVNVSTVAPEAVSLEPGKAELQTWQNGLWQRLLAENGATSPTESTTKRPAIEKANATALRAAKILRQHNKARKFRLKYKPKQSAGIPAPPVPGAAKLPF